MAIEKMSLVNIVGPVSMFDETAKHCIIGMDFHPENTSNIVSQKSVFMPFNESNPFNEALRQIIEFASRAKIALKYSDFFELTETQDEIKKKIADITGKYSDFQEKISQLKKRITEDEQILVQLDHLKDVTVNLDDLFNFEFVKFRFGRMPRDNYERLKTYGNINEVYYTPTVIEKEYVWGMYLSPKVFINKTDALFISLSFERVRISDRAHGTPYEAYTVIRNEIESTKINLNNINAQYNEFMKETLSNILAYYSKIRYLHDTFELRKFAVRSESNFYIAGWIIKEKSESFADRFSLIEGVSCIIEEPDEVPTIAPPTKLKNKAIFKPFEEFVKMYGLPSYNETDPSPLLAITYTLLFGLMFGDAGQGLVLALAGLGLWFYKKTSFGKILCTIGISSVIFGLIYGSIFGYEISGFGIFGIVKPLRDTNNMLISAVGLGIVLISIAMIVNIINGFKQKSAGKTFFSNNGITGIIFYWAIIFAVILLFGFGKNIFSLWYILVFVGIPLLLFFFKEPLDHIITHRTKWKPDSIGEYIIASFFELIEVLLSFVTNTISFIRVGAFALSHAGMMLVVFMLAGEAGKSKNIFIIIFGNIFVMLLEGMIVGIQVLRLEFYEMFSRFFDGNGREYEPYTINYDSKNE